MAILIDECGMARAVTMEDLIEEIVGELDDEPEHGKPGADNHRRAHECGRWADPLGGCNEQLDLHLPEGDYETLAGFILKQLGRLPQPGDSLTYNGIRLTVFGDARAADQAD